MLIVLATGTSSLRLVNGSLTNVREFGRYSASGLNGGPV